MEGIGFMKVCTAEQMRKIDKSASDFGAIPSIVLMENAAIACVDEILSLKNVKSVAIFCGKGNNGGDGFAIARHLFMSGIDTEVYLVCGSDFSKDALINYEIISRMGIKIKEINDTDLLELYIKNTDVVVDAIFGTGVKGEIFGIAAEVINIINKNSSMVVSVDIPSGINADTGEILGVCVKADKTITFAAYKRGLLLFPGADFAGDITVADISIPEYIIKEQNINVNIIDKQLIKRLLPERKNNSHKGDYGKILIIGGSVGLTGAVAMAADACVKSGAGLVTVAVCDEINDILEVKLTEPMTLPVASTNGHLDKSCISDLSEKINHYDVCLFGPGLGRSEDIKEILSHILKVSEIPVIIDADGLYALSENPKMLEECNCNLILTPHEAEMARLLRCTTDHIRENRLEASLTYATENGVTLILKGHHTIVTSVGGEQYINNNGNSGMACGGSGDVLSGMVAAFAARCHDECDAAVLGVYMHGLSGDIAQEKIGQDALTPTDITDNIGNAFLRVCN